MRKFTTTIILLIFFKFCYSQIVVINEILSLNNNTILDDFGDRSDWIELYNTSEDTVDLSSWYLSDDENNVLKWIFPDTSICPHGFILIFCSGRDTLSGYLHSSFKLKSSGEPVFLSDAYHNLVDYFLPVSLENDVSYGRKNDGSPDYAYFYKTSPGATNSNNILLNEISFSSNEGFYETNIQLSIFSQDTMGQIFYTINGNEPVPGDYYTFTYNEPISLLAIQSLPALYSYIQTSPTDIPGFFASAISSVERARAGTPGFTVMMYGVSATSDDAARSPLSGS